jgi:GntR family transcriptional regulator/MocR family aminotransferase
VLFPGFRHGYLVVPESLVSRVEYAAALLPAHQSLLDQMVVCDFIAQGHFAHHLARMRSLYAERSLALIEALNDVFSDHGHAESCGMHLLLRLPAHCDDVSLAATARSHGLAVNALSSMSVNANTRRGLLLGYTNILPERAMDAALSLRRALQAHLPRRAESAATDNRMVERA